MTRPLGTLRLLAAITVFGAGCRDEGPGHDGAEVTGAFALPGNDSVITLDSARAESLGRRQPGALGSVTAEPVVGWTGPGGRAFEVLIRTSEPQSATTRPFGTIARRNSARDRSLGQYPCTSCHLGRAMVLRDQRIPDAHQDITPLHPAQTRATCSACHAADNVELLALKSGERATLDHTYRLCAQCHFAQAEAWAGGGHGKRLDGWQGRRVGGCGAF